MTSQTLGRATERDQGQDPADAPRTGRRRPRPRGDTPLSTQTNKAEKRTIG